MTGSRVHDRLDPGLAAGEEQVAERDDAEQPVVAGGDEGGVDRLGVDGLPAQRLERLGRGHVRPEEGVVRGHDRADGALGPGGEAAEVVALGLGEDAEQRLLALLVQGPVEVGALVVAHRPDDRRALVAVEGRAEAGLGLARR